MFRQVDRPPATANRRAWLYRIATNLFLHHCRAARRQPETDLEEAHASSTPTPSESLEFDNMETVL